MTNIYVTQGQRVTPGQLLATLNPQSAEVTLEQARASLQSAIGGGTRIGGGTGGGEPALFGKGG